MGACVEVWPIFASRQRIGGKPGNISKTCRENLGAQLSAQRLHCTYLGKSVLQRYNPCHSDPRALHCSIASSLAMRDLSERGALEATPSIPAAFAHVRRATPTEPWLSPLQKIVCRRVRSPRNSTLFGRCLLDLWH